MSQELKEVCERVTWESGGSAFQVEGRAGTQTLQQENTCRLKKKEARVGHRSRGSVGGCGVLLAILSTLALTAIKL